MDDDWYYDPQNTLSNSERDAFLELLERERHFMVEEGYHNDIQKAALRKKAIKIIAQRSRTENFDAFVPYLAMNYFDQYLSKNQVPAMGRTLEEDLDLLATCCLTLASKMRRNDFRVDTFLNKNSINIDKSKLLKMEREILTKLEWRLRSMTALGFLRYYLTMFADPRLGGNIPSFEPRHFQEIIIQSQGDIKFTRFRPSLVTISTLLTLCYVQSPERYYPFFKEKFLGYNEFKEEPLSECLEEMEKLLVEKNIVAQNPDEVDRNLEPPLRAIGGRSQPIDIPGRSGGAPIQRRSAAPVEEIDEVHVEESRAEYIEVQNPNECESIQFHITDIPYNEVDRNLGPPSQPIDIPDRRRVSQIQQRSGKAPVEEIEEVPVQESRAEYTVMNFELKWYDPEAPDQPIIDTRHLQSAATSEGVHQFNQCWGCNVL